jgi:hypothetical protein
MDPKGTSHMLAKIGQLLMWCGASLLVINWILFREQTAAIGYIGGIFALLGVICTVISGDRP